MRITPPSLEGYAQQNHEKVYTDSATIVKRKVKHSALPFHLNLHPSSWIVFHGARPVAILKLIAKHSHGINP